MLGKVCIGGILQGYNSFSIYKMAHMYKGGQHFTILMLFIVLEVPLDEIADCLHPPAVVTTAYE